MAAIFIVDSFGVTWHTITQIPANRNLALKRPDFEGYDPAKNRFLFEAKGTSSITGVLPAIEQAITQVKTYPENALHKFVIASYFSGDRRAFPSYTFVLDPQMPDIVPADEKHAILLHYIKVLDFIGFLETRKSYIDLLKVSFTLEASQESINPSTRLENKTVEAKRKFNDSFDKAVQSNSERIEFHHKTYYGRSIQATAESETYSFFCGVDLDIIEMIQKDKGILEFPQNISLETNFYEEEHTSVFSDGTILKVEKKS